VLPRRPGRTTRPLPLAEKSVPVLDQDVRCAQVIVALPAQIDLASAERAYDQLCTAFASGAPVVVADFTCTTVRDCSSLHRPVTIQHHAAARDAELRLVCPTPRSSRKTPNSAGRCRHAQPLVSTSTIAANTTRPSTGLSRRLGSGAGKCMTSGAASSRNPPDTSLRARWHSPRSWHDTNPESACDSSQRCGGLR
jgi:hypothetical protein